MLYILFLLGVIIGLLLAIILLLAYRRKEAIITQFLDHTLENKEKAQFYEPIGAEEQVMNIFDENK